MQLKEYPELKRVEGCANSDRESLGNHRQIIKTGGGDVQ
jgi:hypothetical protein